MRNPAILKASERHRAETAVFASLGLAGVLAIVFTTASRLGLAARSDAIATARSSNPAVVAACAPVQKHARYELWRLQADARTVVAGLCYLLDPRA